jgi:hypothetical protein
MVRSAEMRLKGERHVGPKGSMRPGSLLELRLTKMIPFHGRGAAVDPTLVSDWLTAR